MREKSNYKRSKYGILLPKNDTQADAVYDWGANYILKWDHHFLDLNTCKLIAQDVFASFLRINYPKIVLSPKDNSCCFYHPDSNKIEMCESMRFRPILLHELAHALIHSLYRKENPPHHGKEFMGIYMLLLNRWSKIPMIDMKQTLNLNGIQYEFKYLIDKGFRVKRSLTNTKKDIVLTKRKMPGYSLCEPKQTGGYKFVYIPDYWVI